MFILLPVKAGASWWVITVREVPGCRSTCAVHTCALQFDSPCLVLEADQKPWGSLDERRVVSGLRNWHKQMRDVACSP
jgi:hypothetical protein